MDEKKAAHVELNPGELSGLAGGQGKEVNSTVPVGSGNSDEPYVTNKVDPNQGNKVYNPGSGQQSDPDWQIAVPS